MAEPPARGSSGGSLVPDRRLSNEEFELVIRRAAELQAKAAENTAEGGMSEGELVRIGQELGLSRGHLAQALAEVRDRNPPSDGWMDRMMGEGGVRTSRTILGDADEIRDRLEQYLEKHEFMVVQRRFPDRVVFVRASGFAASLARATSEFSRRRPPLKVDNLTVSVQPLEEGFSYITLSTERSGVRAGYLAGATATGLGGGGGIAFALAIAVAPPAALVGVPVLLGSLVGFRQMYQHELGEIQVQLDSLLDRLEHDELPVRRLGPGRR